jgi:hypothetical protein
MRLSNRPRLKGMDLACPVKRGAGGADFAILFGIGIAIDIAIDSSDVRNPFRPRQRLRLRLRPRF